MLSLISIFISVVDRGYIDISNSEKYNNLLKSIKLILSNDPSIIN